LGFAAQEGAARGARLPRSSRSDLR
jgi:hypothetical protein